MSRPLRPNDKLTFQKLEAQIATPLWLQIEASASASYFLSAGDRLLNRLTNTRQWARAFTAHGNPIGFLMAITSGNQTKGLVPRPLLADNQLAHLPAMLHEATDWLVQWGKTAVQIAIPDMRHALIADLQNQGWVKTQNWIRLVKWLNK